MKFDAPQTATNTCARGSLSLAGSKIGTVCSSVNRLFLHHLDLEVTLGQQLLKLRVLSRQGLEPLHIGRLHLSEICRTDSQVPSSQHFETWWSHERFMVASPLAFFISLSSVVRRSRKTTSTSSIPAFFFARRQALCIPLSLYGVPLRVGNTKMERARPGVTVVG